MSLLGLPEQAKQTVPERGGAPHGTRGGCDGRAAILKARGSGFRTSTMKVPGRRKNSQEPCVSVLWPKQPDFSHVWDGELARQSGASERAVQVTAIQTFGYEAHH